jgi:S-adenosylmethionine decarboxylase
MTELAPTPPRQEPFGVHLMIDGQANAVPLMTDAPVLRRLLHDLPVEMGMHAIFAPVVVEVGPNCLKDPGGLSGFVMIAKATSAFRPFRAAAL